MDPRLREDDELKVSAIPLRPFFLYKNIIEKVGLEPEEILFLSDIEQELEAGMQTYWLIREGDSNMSFEKASSKYPAARPFKKLNFLFKPICCAILLKL